MAAAKNTGTGSKKKAGPASKEQDQQTSDANNLGEEVAAAASDARKSLGDAASGATQNFRQQITERITAQQERAVDTLETVALLLQQAGEHARKEEKATVAEYTDRAAEQVERLSDAIRDREADQLITETKQFAQRQPGLFVGGALAAGFLATRFLRSSAQPQASNGQQEAAAGGELSGEDNASSGAYGGEELLAHAGDVSMGAGAAMGTSSASALGGTTLEEDAAILAAVEEEALLQQQGEGLGGTTGESFSDSAFDSETR